MSEENNLKKAFALLQSGRKEEAAKELLALYEKATNNGYRLEVIDVLLSALDPIKENDKLIKTADEGVKIAHQMNRKDVEAYLMARKADFFTNEVSLLKYNQHNLKLASDWVGFATEADKNEYERLTREIMRLENETDSLIEEAISISEGIGNKKTEGYVWMSLGQVISTRYLHFKMDAMKGSSRRAKWWLRLTPLRRHGLENYLFFSFGQIKQLREYISTFTEAFLKATKIFRGINDSAEAYALYNLANNLNIAFEFKKARKYLAQARAVAQKHNELFLLKQIEEMEQIVRDKHRNTPNYLEGETRNFPKKIDDNQ